MKKIRLPQVGDGNKKDPEAVKHRFRKWRRKMSVNLSTRHLNILSTLNTTVFWSGDNLTLAEMRDFINFRLVRNCAFEPLYF
jgi:hypothetical protein